MLYTVEDSDDFSDVAFGSPSSLDLVLSTTPKETPTFRALKLCLVQGEKMQELLVVSNLFNEVIGIVLKLPVGDKISVLFLR